MEVAGTPTSNQVGSKEQSFESTVPEGSSQSPRDPLRPSSDGKFWSWSTFTNRARAVFLEDGVPTSVQTVNGSRNAVESPSKVEQAPDVKQAVGGSAVKGSEGPILQKGLDAIASSLSLLGDTLGTAIEEGLNMVETKATEILTPETRTSAVRKSVPLWKKSPSISPSVSLRVSGEKSDGAGKADESGLPGDIQLKASRDVAMAMASKAKMLLRELKTVRGDLTFLRDRCAQLEEENRRLRESVVKGTRPDEDDLVRLQLETLLAEKQRLQQENANYARENQFLHEVVQYHQIEFNEDELSVDGPDGFDMNDEEVDQMVTMGVPMRRN
ncbi:uncharacterized protein [Physcomitrium patens]|uniref:Uncharacterized protein n=1 Tax=Physcomitrium patens TaxID=3218 RepID=A0A2K1KA41_PHYPA|nr:uncharacterized protein LOC112284694 isoform X1 [Physcomitrium patens]PNR50653.1 hypothetical protein PHYPA_009839 [Physcomitrium patens]|eukprot:XP_024380514.1 uncharacterized protein LOC112284694 isoform X1 [Physcomitrella patens]